MTSVCVDDGGGGPLRAEALELQHLAAELRRLAGRMRDIDHALNVEVAVPLDGCDVEGWVSSARATFEATRVSAAAGARVTAFSSEGVAGEYEALAWEVEVAEEALRFAADAADALAEVAQ